MKFERYSSVSEYRKEVIPYLEVNEAVNNLPLGIINNLKDSLDSYEEETKPFLGLVRREDGKISLVTLMTPPHNVIVCGNGSDADEVITVAIKYFIKEKIHIPGVIGSVDVAKKFLDRWTEMTGDSVEVAMNQRIYRLDRVNDISKTSGKLRKACEDDIVLIAGWINGFNEDCFEKGIEIEEARKRAREHIEESKIYIWEDEKPVSMVGRARSTKNGIVVSYVYTPPEFRGKGYGTTSVATLSQLLLDEGFKFCSLYTDLANPTSNSIYMKIGYKPVVDSIMYSFSKKD